MASETIEDIVREMREWPSAIDKYDAEYLADRIEAAYKVAISKMETTTHESEAN